MKHTDNSEKSSIAEVIIQTDENEGIGAKNLDKKINSKKITPESPDNLIDSSTSKKVVPKIPEITKIFGFSECSDHSEKSELSMYIEH